jgi:hypothetical protein
LKLKLGQIRLVPIEFDRFLRLKLRSGRAFSLVGSRFAVSAPTLDPGGRSRGRSIRRARPVAARHRPFVASAAGAIALARARALTVSIDPRLFAASSGGG